MLNTKAKTIILGTIMFSIILNSKFPYLHIQKEKVKTVEINKDNNYIYQNVKLDKISNENYVDIQKSIISSLGEVKTQEKELKIEPEWIDMKLTFYTNSYSDCGKTDGIGASNIRLSRGSVAVPKDIPMLTKLYIEGYDVVTAHDRGGAINWIYENGKRYMKVDIFVPNATRKQLQELGVKYTKGYLIKE